MAEEEIPLDVLALLGERVSGPDDLEVLVLLHGAPTTEWEVDMIARHLRLPKTELEAALGRLTAAGLLYRAGGRYAYRSDDPATVAGVDALAELYTRRPTAIMRVLTRLALERVRSSAARAFANAFVFRKPRRDEDG